mmetsp:Transcript_44923/g.82021  ORF Transcript_44923/g.82021 Transcript_44923/m.82021 type:complete len:616 (+) Transcript_44923:96-1943(+)
MPPLKRQSSSSQPQGLGTLAEYQFGRGGPAKDETGGVTTSKLIKQLPDGGLRATKSRPGLLLDSLERPASSPDHLVGAFRRRLLEEKRKSAALSQSLQVYAVAATASTETGAIEARNRQLAAELKVAKDEVTHLQGQLEQLRRRLLDEEHRSQRLSGELDTLKSTCHDLRSENDFLRSHGAADIPTTDTLKSGISAESADLRQAIVSDEGSTIDVLIKQRADVNQDIDGECRSPLFWAAQAGAGGAIAALLRGGAEVSRRASSTASAFRWRNDDALITACQYGHFEACKALLEAKASQDINVCSEYQLGDDWQVCTPLLAACVAGNVSVVELLLEFGADPHIQQADGSGCLHCVVRMDPAEQHLEVVKALLKGPEPRRIADVNLCDALGWTPLLHAMTLRNVMCMRALIAGGADVGLALQAHPGGRDLFAAVDADDVGLLAALLSSGMDPNTVASSGAVDNSGVSGLTPLAAAVRHGHRSCVEILLEARADPSQETVERVGIGKSVTLTPLASAAIQDRTDLVDLLLVHGANVNQEVPPPGPVVAAVSGAVSKYTAMHFAAQAGALESVKLLHQAGSSPALLGADEGAFGIKPAKLARDRGFLETASYLESAARE